MISSCIIIIFFSLFPHTAYARGESVTLSRNGLDLLVDLPLGCELKSQITPSHSISYLGDLQVVLATENTTVVKKLKFEKKVYQGLKKSYPDTTYFEELPDLVTEMGTFKVCKLTYASANGAPKTSLQAFCKINYRYIYTISLSVEGDIDYDMLMQFTTTSITKTPFAWDSEMFGLTASSMILGLIIILYQLIQKHFRPHATGRIIDTHIHPRFADIMISYHLKDGTLVTGAHSMIYIAGVHYARRLGTEVKISYSEKKPSKVNIITYKLGYAYGLFFLILAALGALLMIFKF